MTKKPKCNCHQWAEIGTYFCPVHGYENQFRRGAVNNPATLHPTKHHKQARSEAENGVIIEK